jgi:hypothetical protein
MIGDNAWCARRASAIDAFVIRLGGCRGVRDIPMAARLVLVSRRDEVRRCELH